MSPPGIRLFLPGLAVARLGAGPGPRVAARSDRESLDSLVGPPSKDRLAQVQRAGRVAEAVDAGHLQHPQDAPEEIVAGPLALVEADFIARRLGRVHHRATALVDVGEVAAVVHH